MRYNTPVSRKSLFIILFVFVLVGLVVGWWRWQNPLPQNIASTLGLTTEMAGSPDSASATRPEPSPITIMFVGDLQFDRYIRQQANRNGGYDSILAGVQPLLSTADLVVGNLEGPVTTFESKSLGSEIGSPANYIFTFDPAVVPALQQTGNWLVNLGNNHILNFGQAGLDQTYLHLNQANLPYFGHTQPDQPPAESAYTWQHQGASILFLNYNQFIDTDWAGLIDFIWQQDPDHDLIILYTHWGNEYQPVANQVIQDQADQFVAAGVDVIIGSHPHVIQQSEVIQGKTVYYSLGNFVFDQYFQPEVKEGLVVELEYDPQSGALQFAEHLVELQLSGQTVVKPMSNDPAKQPERTDDQTS